MAQLVFVILILWLAIYPVDSAIQFLNNRHQEIQNRTNLHLEPHNYQIYYVNIGDLRHHYRNSVADVHAG